nr:MAG TPA: hypothetical protein [Caudoviricetes sp.]
MRDDSAFFVWQKYCLVIREKQHRRGEHRSPETLPSSLRLATSSKEEALRNRLLS